MLKLILNLFANKQFLNHTAIASANISKNTLQNTRIDGFYPIRQWLNQIEIKNPELAHLICRIIPVQCPFARDISLFGRTIIKIPPLCKLNPVYEEVVSLRFRALCYLADECGEDVGCYC